MGFVDALKFWAAQAVVGLSVVVLIALVYVAWCLWQEGKNEEARKKAERK